MSKNDNSINRGKYDKCIKLSDETADAQPFLKNCICEHHTDIFWTSTLCFLTEKKSDNLACGFGAPSICAPVAVMLEGEVGPPAFRSQVPQTSCSSGRFPRSLSLTAFFRPGEVAAFTGTKA